jgi:hypothetical protein
MFVFFVLTLLLALAGNLDAKFNVEDSISLGGGVDTNPLFLDGSSSMDYLMRVDPQVDLIYDVSSFYTKIGGGFDYDKYFKNTNQSFFKWKFDSLISVKPEESTDIDLVNNYDNNSDPIMMTTEDRAKWSLYTMKASMHYLTKSKLWRIDGDFESYTKRYDSDVFKNFNNNKRYLTVKTKFYFFPETAFIMGYKGGYSYYTAGHDVAPYGNTDSVYVNPFLGLEGQLTTNYEIFLKFGFLFMDYEYGSNFREPVLELKVTNLLSKTSSVSGIYERMAYDSTYSNFYVDNKLALEFKNIWYDSLVNLTTLQYIYRYYRIAPKRIDNRLALISEIAFPVFTMSSIKENVCFFTRLLAEWVNSDAYNSFNLYNGPDPAASYKRLVLLVGFTTKY